MNSRLTATPRPAFGVWFVISSQGQGLRWQGRGRLAGPNDCVRMDDMRPGRSTEVEQVPTTGSGRSLRRPTLRSDLTADAADLQFPGGMLPGPDDGEDVFGAQIERITGNRCRRPASAGPSTATAPGLGRGRCVSAIWSWLDSSTIPGVSAEACHPRRGRSSGESDRGRVVCGSASPSPTRQAHAGDGEHSGRTRDHGAVHDDLIHHHARR